MNPLMNYLEDLIHVTRFRHIPSQIRKRPCDLFAVILEVCEDFQEAAKDKGIHLHTSLMRVGNFPCDSRGIREVMSQLLETALLNTQEGEVLVEMQKRPGYVFILVSSPTWGIRYRVLKSILSGKEIPIPHVRGSAASFYLAKAWADAHEGQIWPESTGTPHGTTITFGLPI